MGADGASSDPKTTKKGPPTWAFWSITGIYAVGVLVGAAWLGFFEPDGIPLEPQEWGDVLAGTFSPLAFLWLVYASLSQRAELELQRNELAQNNDYQEKQFRAMARQADALIKQTRYGREQSRALLRDHYVQQQEIRVWTQWFRNALFELHHETIDKTGRIRKTTVVPLSPDDAELLFRGTTLNGILAVESALPRIHQLPPGSQAEVLKVLARLKSYDRAISNFCFAAKESGSADAALLDKFCKWLNEMAVEAWHAAAHIPEGALTNDKEAEQTP